MATSTPIRQAVRRPPVARPSAVWHMSLDRDRLLAAVVLSRCALFAGALVVAASKVV